MGTNNTSFDEVEKLLQEIGHKIEELIAKGAEMSGEAKVEVEKKVETLKKDKFSIEKEFYKRKQAFEEKYHSKRATVSPLLEQSKTHFHAGLKALSDAVKNLINNK
ncbi:hypothetical protein [Echinicola vietnamensis]|uniref:Uncharacterized protein n=1 Tax=Echinicola vietnamensis (strain DSM 17526 / LMG 23754 / KMM 6221) TaxID=926556 RepID=L0FW01_ECHVK|nr:hypothetical protein [Echinicola vietnamensis]AGA78054.1 hypothetical protein Echvi_1795 [Echinicola vietnamensis DSM 17526]